MPLDLDDGRRIQRIVKDGFDRLKRFRRTRAQGIRQFVGQYYRDVFGMECDEPLNMIFHVIRSLLPSIIMQNPENWVTTEFMEYKQYAYMLGLALDGVDQRIKFKNIVRRALVDSFFCMGIVKTGLASTDQLIEFGDIRVDPGQVYADNVDFDDYVLDPSCMVLEEAVFTGHRSRVPRQLLLDDDDCDHDMVIQLPRSIHPDSKKRASSLSQQNFSNQEIAELQDFVDVVEIWVPGADSVVTIGDPSQIITDKYIKLQDFYGPKTGPYRYLSLTPPVPGNPLPVAPVSIWYDLHIMVNRLMKKQMERADNQKTILVVDPAAADQGEDMRDARDSEVIFGNPDSAEMFSTKGAEDGTSTAIASLQTWFNYMSGNPDQVGGMRSDADTATQATILAGNANVGLEDTRSICYEFSADVNSDIAWFLHYDPLIDIPMIARKRDNFTSNGFRIGDQIRLTPAQRRGEHFDYAFKLKPKSMTVLDPNQMSQRIIAFATNVVPGLVAAAAQASQMGVPFNVQKAITSLADQLQIGDIVQEWFQDPDFLMRLQLMNSMGPAPEGKAQTNGPLNIQGIRQNGGFPGSRNLSANPVNQGAQDIASMSQRAMKMGR